MALTDADTARLYSDAFQRNAAAMLGQQSFAYADVQSKLDVANYQAGVLNDELAAAQKEIAALKEQVSKLTPEPRADEAAAAASQATA